LMGNWDVNGLVLLTQCLRTASGIALTGALDTTRGATNTNSRGQDLDSFDCMVLYLWDRDHGDTLLGDCVINTSTQRS